MWKFVIQLYILGINIHANTGIYTKKQYAGIIPFWTLQTTKALLIIIVQPTTGNNRYKTKTTVTNNGLPTNVQTFCWISYWHVDHVKRKPTLVRFCFNCQLWSKCILVFLVITDTPRLRQCLYSTMTHLVYPDQSANVVESLFGSALVAIFFVLVSCDVALMIWILMQWPQWSGMDSICKRVYT